MIDTHIHSCRLFVSSVTWKFIPLLPPQICPLSIATLDLSHKVENLEWNIVHARLWIDYVPSQPLSFEISGSHAQQFNTMISGMRPKPDFEKKQNQRWWSELVLVQFQHNRIYQKLPFSLSILIKLMNDEKPVSKIHSHKFRIEPALIRASFSNFSEITAHYWTQQHKPDQR